LTTGAEMFGANTGARVFPQLHSTNELELKVEKRARV